MALPQAVADAQIVITGEGSFDAQSTTGKVPGYIAGLAATAGVPALLIAGSVHADPEGFAGWRSLTELAGDTASASADPLTWLEVAGAQLAAAAGETRQ